MYNFIKKMEKKQNIFLVLGLAIFFCVIYLLSNHKVTRPSPITKHIAQEQKSNVKRPNFVFILTDDQDIILGSAERMQNVKKDIIDEGISFKNSFVASPLCCPSRASIFSGQYVHNHRTYNNSISGGCSSKSWQTGPERKSFVNSLHQSGYQTFFAGKYLNQYGTKGAGGISHIPLGWDWWIGLEGNSRYYNYSLSVNGTREYHGDNSSTDYFTNVIKRRAFDFLDDISSESQPFFIMLSTPACHAPFDFEPKYDSNFTKVKIPRTKNFNVVNDDTKHWLLRLGEQPLPQETIDSLDQVYRKRLRTLITVDVMVKDVIDILRSKDLLDSTYVIFTSDNGFHLGQFSLPIDKREPYEFDIRVPFYIRGPGISNKVIDYPITNIDIAPTILDLAGIPVPRYYDGESLKQFFQTTTMSSDNIEMTDDSTNSPKLHYSYDSQTFRKTLLVEHTGEMKDINLGCEYLGTDLYGCNPKYNCKCSDSKNNTYSCIRHLSQEENFLFCSWKDDENFEELYNLELDSSQLNNTIGSLPSERHNKLRATLNNLKKCKGVHCNRFSKFVF